MKLYLLGFPVDWITIFGLGAQFLFFLRFIYQWIASERKKESVIPVEFWYFSIIGGILIVIYAFLRKDLVFFLGQILALFIYYRNLILFKKEAISENARKYSTLNPIKKYLINHFLERIEKVVATLKVKKVLDIGCGEGYVISFLKEKNRQLKFVGIDISGESLNIAACKNKTEKFILGDINNIDKIFTKEKFDLILVLEVLEHLKDPFSVINKLKSIKTNYYLFSVPNEPFFSLGNLLMGKNISRWGKDREHRSFWSRKEFIFQIGDNFKVIKAVNSLFWTIVLAKKK